jgi:hypothetical protein
VFRVTLHHGRTAHLDVTGARGEAVRRAAADQLGLEVAEIEPFGLAGSGGCTPLRIRLAGGRTLFGKLYATSHLRADRWYKIGRTILYGALEDERSFNSVRRMVVRGHMLRYLRDQGIGRRSRLVRGALPEREYLLVCGFIEDAVEIHEARGRRGPIRSSVALVRDLWDSGRRTRTSSPRTCWSATAGSGDRRLLLSGAALAVAQSVDLAA